MNYHPLLKKVNRVVELNRNSLFLPDGLAYIMNLAGDESPERLCKLDCISSFSLLYPSYI
jgi:hypothetical protein